MTNFEKAVKIILKHEGGYINHPSDPGGETNFGISKRAYPDVDIANLTEEEAAEIYKRDYWDRVKGDELPYPIALCVFDTAVNSGVSRASRWLQETCNAYPDGIVGPNTIRNVLNAWEASHSYVLTSYMRKRLEFLQRLSTWDTFGRGWGRRVDETLQAAIKEIKGK